MDEKGQVGELLLGGVFVIVVILFVLMMMCTTIVPAGHVGIQDTLGTVSNDLLSSGFHFKSPITGVKSVSLQTQLYNVNAAAASKNLQTVKTTVGINYHLDADKVLELYKTVKNIDVEGILMYPATQEILKANTAKFDAEELINQREIITENVNNGLKQRFLVKGIIVENVSTTNFDFGDEYNKAIEEKQVASQAVEKAKYELEKQQIEVQQKINSAEADAKAIKINADAQAYQLDVINSKLTQNPLLNQYKAIEKWDGVLPKVVGGAVPLIDIGIVN